MAIATADEHHLAERAALEDLARLAERAVIAVIEAHADQRPGAAGGIGYSVEFTRRAGSRFFDQDMLSGGRRFGRDECQLVVRGSDEDRVHIIAAHRRSPIGGPGG